MGFAFVGHIHHNTYQHAPVSSKDKLAKSAAKG